MTDNEKLEMYYEEIKNYFCSASCYDNKEDFEEMYLYGAMFYIYVAGRDNEMAVSAVCEFIRKKREELSNQNGIFIE